MRGFAEQRFEPAGGGSQKWRVEKGSIALPSHRLEGCGRAQVGLGHNGTVIQAANVRLINEQSG